MSNVKVGSPCHDPQPNDMRSQPAQRGRGNQVGEGQELLFVVAEDKTKSRRGRVLSCVHDKALPSSKNPTVAMPQRLRVPRLFKAQAASWSCKLPHSAEARCFLNQTASSARFPRNSSRATCMKKT